MFAPDRSAMSCLARSITGAVGVCERALLRKIAPTSNRICASGGIEWGESTTDLADRLIEVVDQRGQLRRQLGPDVGASLDGSTGESAGKQGADEVVRFFSQGSQSCGRKK